MNYLEIRNVNKTYGNKQVLDDISIDEIGRAHV